MRKEFLSLIVILGGIRDSQLDNFCLGYVVGAWEGLWVGGANTYAELSEEDIGTGNAVAFISSTLNICLPDEVDRNQMVAVFAKYLRDNLDLSRFDAAPLIAFTATKETDYAPPGRVMQSMIPRGD